MSTEPNFSSGGGRAAQGPFTWGGGGQRRVCDADGHPYPAGNYGATVAAGMYMVTDDKYGTQQWVYAGEMIHWDGTPDPVRQALREAKAAITLAAKIVGVAV